MQVAVEVTEDQVAKARQTAEFEPWLKTILASIPPEEQRDYEIRAHELFIQGICALKLDLAIEGGLPQENGSLAADQLVRELESATPDQADRLKSQILTELDLSV